MPKVDFGAARKQAEDQGLLGSGDYLKLKEGNNRLRLMSECLPHAGAYQGRKTFKWLCYVVDRLDGKVKPFFMPHTIYKQIEALQLNPDYEFSDVPMPYDVTIHAKGAGTKEVVYTIMAARHNTPVTDAESVALDQAKPLKDLQDKLKQKADSKADAPPDHNDTDFDPRDYDDGRP